MAKILRGEVYAAEPTPLLVLSHAVFNEHSGTVIAVPVTKQMPRAGFPITLELEAAEFSKVSWVKIAQICTFSSEKLGKKLDELTADTLQQVIEGLLEIID